MNQVTFEFICSYLAPLLQKQNSNMYNAIPIEIRIVITIFTFGIRQCMQMIGDLYGIGVPSN
jgi:hypothetical protein